MSPGGDEESLLHSVALQNAASILQARQRAEEELLRKLFEVDAGNFCVALACEPDRKRALKIIRKYLKPDQRVFVGVVSPIDPRIDTPEEVRDRVLEAAEVIPAEQLGTCDDCGFSPFCDDTSTTRETAFAKIRARVEGTRLASERLGR